jgi:membrane-bound lytic murein transglycosylase MltF
MFGAPICPCGFATLGGHSAPEPASASYREGICDRFLLDTAPAFARAASKRSRRSTGSLTITPERQKLVDFARPIWSYVSEIVVTGPQSPEIKTMDDLAGEDVFVRKSSSYYESLRALNARLQAEGKPPVHLTAAPEVLEDEDLLEIVNAGLIGAIVMDRPIAELWKQMVPDIVLHPDVALRTGGEIAWAIRKGSPKLRAGLDAFGAAHKQGTAFGNEVFRRYLKSVKYVKHAASEAEVQKLRALRSYFQAYGEEYRLDWILMAAQGYQESRLDQSVKRPVGAIGVMQVMPTTGKQLRVGNIHQAEPNVHAGVKYIRFMVDRYYKDEPMDDLNKTLFASRPTTRGLRVLQRCARRRPSGDSTPTAGSTTWSWLPPRRSGGRP